MRHKLIRYPAAWKGATALIIANAGSLVGTTAVTSALGYVYWGIAARGFTTVDIGVGATALSATVLLGAAATLGLGTWLVGEIPRRPEEAGSLSSAAIIVSFAVGALLGLTAALLAPVIAPDLRPFATNRVAVLLFSLGVGLSSATFVLDQALLGLLLGGMQLGRNTIFAVAKFAAIVVLWAGPLHRTVLALYGTWIVGQLVSLGLLALLLLIKREKLPSLRPDWRTLRGSLGKALNHHALNVALQAPSLALPLVVTIVLTAGMTAYFYTAWMVTGMVYVAPIALVTTLYAVGSREPSMIATRTRLTLSLATLAGLCATVLLFVAAPTLLGMFGPGYADHGTQPLRLLTLAVFPLIIKDHYVTLCRLHHQVGSAAVWATVGGILELVFAGTGGAVGGLPGLSLGYVVATIIEAVFMANTVFRVVARDVPSPFARRLALLGLWTRTRKEC